MSSNPGSGPGGVRNLRAMFENAEPASSPEPRGRSPADSATSGGSRPGSRVRASFVAVEPSAAATKEASASNTAKSMPGSPRSSKPESVETNIPQDKKPLVLPLSPMKRDAEFRNRDAPAIASPTSPGVRSTPQSPLAQSVMQEDTAPQDEPLTKSEGTGNKNDIPVKEDLSDKKLEQTARANLSQNTSEQGLKEDISSTKVERPLFEDIPSQKLEQPRMDDNSNKKLKQSPKKDATIEKLELSPKKEVLNDKPEQSPKEEVSKKKPKKLRKGEVSNKKSDQSTKSTKPERRAEDEVVEPAIDEEASIRPISMDTKEKDEPDLVVEDPAAAKAKTEDVIVAADPKLDKFADKSDAVTLHDVNSTPGEQKRPEQSLNTDIKSNELAAASDVKTGEYISTADPLEKTEPTKREDPFWSKPESAKQSTAGPTVQKEEPLIQKEDPFVQEEGPIAQKDEPTIQKEEPTAQKEEQAETPSEAQPESSIKPGALPLISPAENPAKLSQKSQGLPSPSPLESGTEDSSAAISRGKGKEAVDTVAPTADAKSTESKEKRVGTGGKVEKFRHSIKSLKPDEGSRNAPSDKADSKMRAPPSFNPRHSTVPTSHEKGGEELRKPTSPRKPPGDSIKTGRVAGETARATRPSAEPARPTRTSVETNRAIKSSAEASKPTKPSADSTKVTKAAEDATKAAKPSVAPPKPESSQPTKTKTSRSSLRASTSNVPSKLAEPSKPAEPAKPAQPVRNASPAPSRESIPHSGFVKPRPKSPTRPINLPSHLIAPTASSAAKYDSSESASGVTRKPSIKKDRPPVSKPAQPARKPQSRPSLPPQPTKRPETEHVDEGFLARMMRPTASSASKTHERPEVKSPPRHHAPAKAKSGVAGALAKGKKKVGEAMEQAKDKITSNGADGEPEGAEDGTVATPPHQPTEEASVMDTPNFEGGTIR